MKVEVIHAGPVVGPQGLIHMSNKYDNVESWTLEKDQLKLVLMTKHEIIFNWAHILRFNIDKYGSVRLD